jgi:rubrerythrin
MMREEFIKHIFSQMEEEIEDVYEYHTLCEEAKKLGMHDFAMGLKEIADEEYTHARYLATVMGEEYNQPPEAAVIWHKWHKMLADMKNK